MVVTVLLEIELTIYTKPRARKFNNDTSGFALYIQPPAECCDALCERHKRDRKRAAKFVVKSV